MHGTDDLRESTHECENSMKRMLSALQAEDMPQKSTEQPEI